MEEGKERERERRDQPAEIQRSLAIGGLFPFGNSRTPSIDDRRGERHQFTRVCVAGASVRACVFFFVVFFCSGARRGSENLIVLLKPGVGKLNEQQPTQLRSEIYCDKHEPVKKESKNICVLYDTLRISMLIVVQDFPLSAVFPPSTDRTVALRIRLSNFLNLKQTFPNLTGMCRDLLR